MDKKQLNDKLYLAIKGGELAECKALLDAGADPSHLDDDNWTPLHCAAWEENKDICQLLFEYGADPQAEDKNGAKPMHWAIHAGSESTVRYFFQKYPESINEPTVEGSSLELLAESRGHPALAAFIVAYRNSLITGQAIHEALPDRDPPVGPSRSTGFSPL